MDSTYRNPDSDAITAGDTERDTTARDADRANPLLTEPRLDDRADEITDYALAVEYERHAGLTKAPAADALTAA